METVSRRKPSPAMVVSLIALFVAMSGVGYAATKLEKNSVKAKHIKDGQVKTGELADGGVGTVDLADNSVTNPKVADNAIGSGEVAADSLAAGDLAPNSVGTSEITNGDLDAVDVGLVSGTATINFASVGAGACLTQLIDTGVDIEGDILSVSVDSSNEFTSLGGLTVHASDSTSAQNIRVNVCNVTGGAIDPASANFQYIVFQR